MARGPHRAAMPRASAPAGRHLGKRADEGPGQKAASCFGPQWRKWQQQTTTGRPTAVRRTRTARLALQNGPGRAAKRHTVVAVVRGMSVLCLPDAHRPFPQPFSVPMMPCSLSPPSAGTVPFSVMPHDSYDCTMIGFCPLNPFGVATWQYVRKTCCKMASCHFAFTLGYAILLDYRNVLLQMSVTLDNVCPKKRANRWLCAAFSIK